MASVEIFFAHHWHQGSMLHTHTGSFHHVFFGLWRPLFSSRNDVYSFQGRCWCHHYYHSTTTTTNDDGVKMASLITSTSSMEVVRTSSSAGLVPPLPLMSDTEDAVLEESSELDDPETLDLSTHGLTKLSRAAPGYDLTTMTLLLDNNSLQRLDNIHTYQCLEKVTTLRLFIHTPCICNGLRSETWAIRTTPTLFICGNHACTITDEHYTLVQS